ncbi:MAG: hypothetical protein PVSMB4_20200 [Ktedonobacterales bacterium]
MCWLDNVRQASAMFEQPAQCVHVGDRSSDIYELFCETHDAGSHFIVRTCVDRLAGDGTQTVATCMQRARCRALHEVEVRDSHGHCRSAVVTLKYCRVRLLPPRAKQRRYSPLTLTVLQAVRRARRTGWGRADRLEAHHRLACHLSGAGHREARLVCNALED